MNYLLEQFNQASKTVLDIHAPQSTRTRTIRPQPKWYNDEIRAEKREQHRLERKWRKNRSITNRKAYMVQHTKVISLIVKAKEHYFKDVLHNAGARDTFKTLGVLLNKNSRVLPSSDTPKELCNKFAQFFTDKVAKIRGNIDCDDDISLCVDTGVATVVENELCSFKELDESEVRNIITSSANKSCPLDIIPTWIIKEYIDYVVPSITCIVNSSLSSGVFPQILKQATVTPIIKKVNLDCNDLQNYRPVSNVNFHGKTIEKAAIIQLNKHLQWMTTISMKYINRLTKQNTVRRLHYCNGPK